MRVESDSIQFLTVFKIIKNRKNYSTDFSSSKPFGIKVPQSIRACIGGTTDSMLCLWGGEFKWDNFEVMHKANRGNATGVVIEYGKNMTSMEHDSDSSVAYTDLLPYAVRNTQDNGEEVITLSEVLLPIADTSLTQRKTLIKDLSDTFGSEEEITEDALRSKAVSYLENNTLGTIIPTLKVAFEPLWKHPEYAAVLERVSLCDTLMVRHGKLRIKAKAKVITTVYDTLSEKYISITLGNASANLLNEFTKVQENTDKAVSKIDRFPTLINSAVEKATGLITGQSGGYVVINTAEETGYPYELLILDNPNIENAVNVWRWNVGGLGFSSTGYNGPYTTAITSSGEIVADWSATQSVTGNYSDVTLKVYLKYASLYVGARDDCTISINGTSETYSSPAISEDDTSTTHSKLLKTKKVRVNHNSDGTKAGVKLSASWRFDGTYSGTYISTITASATISLNSIDRTAPTVKCSVSSITANGFKISATSSAKADVWQYSLDGGSSWTKFSTTEGTSASITLSSLTPNTSYSVRVGARKASNEVYGKSSTVSVKTLGGSTISSVETVEADTSSVSISFSATVYNASYTHSLTIKNGSTTYLTISNISFTKGTADRTITLTSTQRTNLLSKMSSLKSFTGTFVLTTYNGSTQIGSTSSDTATIKTTSSQSAPTMASFTYLDANSTTVNVTGNNQLFIQGYSSLQITPATATAKNQATIVSYSATCNGVTKSNTSGDVLTLGKISKSGSLTVEVKATDSRGYTVTKSTKISVIAYAKPKINSLSLRRTNNIEAEMQLTFDGSISPVTVSSTQKNNLTYVRYRYKKTSASSYGSYTSILSSVTKSGSSFSYSNLELCSLDSGSSYDFHIQIRDSLGSLSSLDLYYVVPQGTPLVALRKQKVGINTPSPEAALHVVGDVKITGTVSGSFAPSSLSSAVPISKGGTGATTAAGAAKNIINGQSITPKTIDITGGQYWINDVYGINMQNSDIVNLNGLYFQDAVDTQSEGINFYRSSTTWDRLYSNSGTLYYAPNCDHDTYPGTRYQIYHSGGATIPISKGGTGATSAADARSNLGLACTSLYKGTLTSGSATFTYGSHKAYIIMGRPLDGSAICTLIVPKSMITTGGLKYQFADEVNYVAFTLSYSGTTGTVTISTRSGDGFISRVFGVN